MRRRKKRNWIFEMYQDNKLYIWVVIGVLVISGVTIGITVGNLDNNEIVPNVDITAINDINNNNIAETNTKPVKENDYEKQEKIVESKTLKENKVEKKKDSVKEEEEEKEKPVKKLEFIMPLEGEIIKDYSDNTLIYSNTLEEWVAHTGVDIEAQKAMPVKAIESGNVVGVKEDPRYGYTIIIDHGQGYKSIYCNLSTLDMVFVGKSVEKGQVISGVGETALFEIKDNPHLHFEIMYNEEYINPVDVIK